MKILIVTVLAIIFGLPAAAFSCDRFIAFSDEQASEILAKLETLDGRDYATVFEFNRLLCAERKILRDTARQAGRQSSNTAIRSTALQNTLFEKDVINLEVMSKENMTDEEVLFLKTTPIISYPVMFVDREKGCISLQDGRQCRAVHILSVSGSEVDLRYNRQVAKMRLTEEGKLEGIWSNGDGRKPVSVSVEIRLD